jgi:hypothetical protein
MSIIRPPISKDQSVDSWANQVTEAINKGLFAPSVNPADGAALIAAGGNSSATLYLYTRTNTATAPAAVDEVITYNYKTASFDGDGTYGSANWTASPPNIANGNYLWICVVNISASVGKEVIQPSSWSTPQIFSVNGSSSIAIDCFIRKAGTAPGTPTGGSYNFGTTTLTVPTGNPSSEVWNLNLPAASTGDTTPAYISTAIATVVGSDGTDSTLTWSTPIKMVENGAIGISPNETGEGLVYYTQASASNPGAPSATDFNFTTGAFTGLTSGWQTTPVTVNITTTTALFWSSRFRVIESPGAGSPTVTFDTPIPSVNFGTNIQSDNYVSGSAGWQIQRASGDAEFNNIDVRGGVVASSVVVGGPTIYATNPTSSTSGTAVSNATGMYLNSVHNRMEVWDSGTLRVAIGGLNFLP